MRHALLAGALCLAAGLPAAAQTAAQRNILSNAAMVFTAARRCTGYIVNMNTVAHILESASLNIDEQPYKAVFAAEVHRAEKLADDHGAQAFCDKVYEQFRPGGPLGGMMVRR